MLGVGKEDISENAYQNSLSFSFLHLSSIKQKFLFAEWNISYHVNYLFREFEFVRETMHSAISMNKTEVLDDVLNNFSEVTLMNMIMSMV